MEGKTRGGERTGGLGEKNGGIGKRYRDERERKEKRT